MMNVQREPQDFRSETEWNKARILGADIRIDKLCSISVLSLRTNAADKGSLAALVFDDNQFPITEELMKIVYTCTSCGKQVADTIVTGCTSCFSNMNKVVETEGIELEIRDISVLVAKAMGIRL
jgi:Zn finger protein HypA/HybF involved in hydrogenase expression